MIENMKKMLGKMVEILERVALANQKGTPQAYVSSLRGADGDMEVGLVFPSKLPINPWDKTKSRRTQQEERFISNVEKLYENYGEHLQSLVSDVSYYSDQIKIMEAVQSDSIKKHEAVQAGLIGMSDTYTEGFLSTPEAKELLSRFDVGAAQRFFKDKGWDVGVHHSIEDQQKEFFLTLVERFHAGDGNKTLEINGLLAVLKTNREKQEGATSTGLGRYQAELDTASEILKERLKSERVDVGRIEGLLTASTEYAKELVKADVQSGNLDLLSTEKYGDFLKNWMESTYELLTNPELELPLIHMGNVRGALNGVTGNDDNRTLSNRRYDRNVMKAAQRKLYGDELGINSNTGLPALLKAYSDQVVSRTSLDELESYNLFRRPYSEGGPLENYFFRTERLFDFGNSSKQHPSKGWLTASAGMSDASPLHASPEMQMDRVLKDAEALSKMNEGLVQEIGLNFRFSAQDSALENPDAVLSYYDNMLDALTSGFSIENFSGAEDIGVALGEGVQTGIDAVVTALQDEEFLTAVDTVQSMMNDAMIGIVPSEEDLTRLDDAWAYITDGQASFMEGLMALSGGDAESANNMLAGFLNLDTGSLEGAKAQIQDFAKSFQGIDTEFDYASASAADLAKRGQDLSTTFNAARTTLAQSSIAIDTLTKGQKALAKAQEGVVALTGDERKALEDTRKLLGYKAEGYEGLGDAIDAGIQKETLSVNKSIALMKAAHNELGKNIKQARRDPGIDKRELTGMDQQYEAQGATLEQLEAAKRKSSASRRARAAAQAAAARAAAAAAAEQARQEALQKDYELLAHKKHMNELTLEQELQTLEKIKKQHRLNAEEIMAWEEKVYDVKQAMKQRDAGSLDTVGDGLITALNARYQAMLDAEVGRLDASRQAWEDWRDSSVQAIQDQIDALDELAKAEDREKTDQEELRKIAKLRQDIEFEQDEYNRMQLQQQLDQALESREERLLRLEREDQKDALRAQIETINEQADTEIKALNEEQKTIEEAYAEQMKTAAIRAEAEKLLMKNNQKEIIGLISEYAPDYNALGKTLGEKLLEGFQNKTADIVKWFDSLNDVIHAIQEAASVEAIAAANVLYQDHATNQSAGVAVTPAVTNVTQTVNFNEPVESLGFVA